MNWYPKRPSIRHPSIDAEAHQFHRNHALAHNGQSVQGVVTGVVALWEIPALNAEIVTLAAAVTTPESPVIIVDRWTDFDAAADTYDGVHPNQSGEQKMAAKWFEALDGVLEPTALVFTDDFELGDTSTWN